MNIFSILSMVGGLALFLYGMDVMGDSLMKLSGGKLEKILEKLTAKRIMAVLLGAGVTAVIQSSSATTVMVVGFVNSGIMQLSQAVGIIMGANIGTTITSWLLSLTGIEGSNLFVQMLKPSSFSPILAVIGMILIMTSSKDSKKNVIGQILLGFTVLMFGMETMSGAVAPLRENASFTGILTRFSNPILGMMAGAVLTAVIQSSSASVGILQALCATGVLGYGAAFPIIMGQNIGTCVTAILSSLGANKNARRASMIHLYFNMIGTIVFMVVFYLLNSFMHFAFLANAATPAGIAVIHSLFNIGCAIMLFPFGNQLVKLACLTIRDSEEEVESKPAVLTALDTRFLEQPSFAMELCKNASFEMATKAKQAFYLSMQTIGNYSDNSFDKVSYMEDESDLYETVLGDYLVSLSARNLTKKDSQWLSLLLHCNSCFERISDYALNVVRSAREMEVNGWHLTEHGQKELVLVGNQVYDIFNRTLKALTAEDLVAAHLLIDQKEDIAKQCLEIKKHHIDRLRKGVCSLETGLVMEDILNSLERVAAHCTNVAEYLLQTHEDGYEIHD